MNGLLVTPLGNKSITCDTQDAILEEALLTVKLVKALTVEQPVHDREIRVIIDTDTYDYITSPAQGWVHF